MPALLPRQARLLVKRGDDLAVDRFGHASFDLGDAVLQVIEGGVHVVGAHLVRVADARAQPRIGLHVGEEGLVDAVHR